MNDLSLTEADLRAVIEAIHWTILHARTIAYVFLGALALHYCLLLRLWWKSL